MNYFYVTYDMTPYTEHSEDYIQVGIAPSNPMNLIGESQYNSSSNGYNPVPGDQSSAAGSGTVITPGGTDTPITPGGTTPIVTPGGNTNSAPTWMDKNKTWVVIVACLLFIIVMLIVCYCMKQRKNDPYYDQKYSSIGDTSKMNPNTKPAHFKPDEEEETLDLEVEEKRIPSVDKIINN